VEIGSWISIGISNDEFGVSCQEHVGKGTGSCAYYTDSSTHSIFTRNISHPVRPLQTGDRVGCFLDRKSTTISFFVNGNLVKSLQEEWNGKKKDVWPTVSLGSGTRALIVEYPIVPESCFTKFGNSPMESDPDSP